MASNTTRSKARLEALGYAVAVVEHWDSFARKRRDLYGCFDLLACGPDGVVFLQTTSRGNISSRVKKIADCWALDGIRKAGVTILVDGWDKYQGRWRCKTVDIS